MEKLEERKAEIALIDEILIWLESNKPEKLEYYDYLKTTLNKRKEKKKYPFAIHLK